MNKRTELNRKEQLQIQTHCLRVFSRMGLDQGLINLSKCSKDQLPALLHRVVDGLCGRQMPQYKDYSSVWGLEQWWEVLDASRDMVKLAVKQSWTKDELKQELEQLPDDLCQCLTEVIWVRHADIRHALVSSTTAISHASLTNFDWQLKLVMSSDRLASVQEPLVSLDLNVQGQTGERTVSVELGKDDLAKMINSLEAANKAVLQLKT